MSHMFLTTSEWVDSRQITIVVRRYTHERLARTCFRGSNVAVAGNFFAWRSAYELLRDEMVQQPLVEDMKESYRDRTRTNSVCIECPCNVGWSGTESLESFETEDLERFWPNRTSCGLRVRRERTHIYAPRTNLVTIAYELKKEDERLVAVVHTIYPGEDVGEIRGNVTDRESVVFFDWDHPGVVAK